MLLVVDANVLFGALIGRGKTLEIFLSDKVYLLAPEFLFEEFEKHKFEIAEKGNASDLDTFKWDWNGTNYTETTLLSTKGINITSIKDATPVPHNGPKPKKPRRV